VAIADGCAGPANSFLCDSMAAAESQVRVDNKRVASRRCGRSACARLLASLVAKYDQRKLSMSVSPALKIRDFSASFVHILR
jgi:hypothetical protein